VPAREAADAQKDLWNRIAQAIEAGEMGAAPPAAAMPAARVIPLWRQTWVRAAAAVLLVMGVGWLLWLRPKYASGEVVAYQTAFGQIRQITLPDGSEIFLNANSRLSYPRNWENGRDREVSLTGEAFFAVQPQRKPRKFKVQLAGAQVEVLGTEFTVTNRPSLTRVVLNHGQVKVGVGDARQQSALMSPGDLVEINRRENRMTKTRVARPENYSAFVQHVIEFNDAPLSEVARVLHDHYGYKVTFQPAALAQKRFTSSNPENRVDLLLFAIEKSFNLQVSRKGKHITILDAGR
jgi:ferric-dicitrate binding protein FerR (iron transport regulator)